MKAKKHLPHAIADSEKIARAVFSPMNLTNKGDALNPNFFKPPAGIDEVSVNRLCFTSLDFCKKHAKKIQKPLAKKSYFGLALLDAGEIREAKAETVSAPTKGNIFHANIKIGFSPTKGEPLPAEYLWKVREMTKKAMLFMDSSPESERWCRQPFQPISE